MFYTLTEKKHDEIAILQDELVSKATLALPHCKGHLILDKDVLNKQIGFALMKKQPDGRKSY